MIIQCDFDGTIIKNNLSSLIREHFGPDAWRDIEADYLSGKITVEESNRRQFSQINESKERLQEFVRCHINIRQGFHEFVADCKEKANHLVIVSSGLDFYIETVLNEIGISDIETYCGKAEFTDNGITVQYYSHNGNIIECDFKRSYLDWFRERNDYIVYIGDGLSDVEAACSANCVFATGYLATSLKEERVQYSYFTDFDTIRNNLAVLRL